MTSQQTISSADFRNFDFLQHPVWVFERQSGRILAANAFASDWLGYSNLELKSMTIAELRVSEQQDEIRKEVGRIKSELHDAGCWKLLRKNNTSVFAHFNWRAIEFDGTDGVLATIRDVTSETELQQIAENLRANTRARLTNYRRVFESLPGMFAVLAPGNYEILAASDAFVELSTSDRNSIIGKSLFEVFPRQSSARQQEQTNDLQESLQWIETFKQSDTLAVQRYPLQRPDGSTEERYWSLINTPVVDTDGDIQYLIHRIEDLTSLYRNVEETAGTERLQFEDNELIQGVLLRSNEVRQALLKAQEQNARLRTAEKLLDLGAWEADIDSRILKWSEKARKIYGCEENRISDFSSYMLIVHPDDKRKMNELFANFINKNQQHFEFSHRVIADDSSVKHIQAVAERHKLKGRNMLVGYVQDITDLVGMHERYAISQQLLRMAGEKVRLGGWRLDLEDNELFWTSETAAIHGLPADVSPTVEEAINFYPPEYRGQIEQALNACIEDGTEIDEILQIQAVNGERVWVRSMGMAKRNENGEIVAVQGAFQDISSLMEAKSRASASERQRLEILETMGEGFATLDESWCFTYANKQAEKIFDRQRLGLVGRDIWELFPEMAASEISEQFQITLKEKESREFETYLPNLECWFRISAHPISSGNKGLAVYFNDVTTERARQQRLTLLESAVEDLEDVVLITDADEINAPDGPRIIYANQAVEGSTGHKVEELLDQTPRIFQGPKTDRMELDKVRSAMEKGESVAVELINYKKSGDEFWVELRISPVFDCEGKMTAFVAIQRDVTDVKQSEISARLNEERFRLVANATSDVIWDWDLESDEVWWSSGLLSVFGHDPENIEAGPESWSNRIAPEDKGRVLESIHSVINGGGKLWEEEYGFKRADGRTATVLDKGFVLRDEQGRATRMLGSMVDLTNQRDLERQVREAQKLDAIGKLTGGVAHDFNNLLTVILGNSEELSERLKDPLEIELANMIVAASERATELTNRLLAFARRQVLRPVIMDVNGHLLNLESLLKRTLGEDIDVKIREASEPAMIEVDPGQLEVSILNLAINSRHAMPRGGQLTIEVNPVTLDAEYTQKQEIAPGNYVCIMISDNGSGMTEEVLANAVEPFFTTKETGEGSGLGLSMVYGFTKQSKGHIKIYSELGYGTTVKLYFPAADKSQLQERDTETVNSEPHGGETILIVEDDEMVRAHLNSVLEFLGYKVLVAEDGQQALKIITTNDSIDLLLTDVVLPGGLSGPEIAERVSEYLPGIKILFTSGYPEHAIKRDGRLKSDVELLSKPYRRKQVAQLVRKVLDK